MARTKNVLGKEAEVYIGPATKKSKDLWNEKEITKDCQGCPYCIDGQEARDVIRTVNKRKINDKWTPLSEEYILGICNWGLWPKALVSPKTGDMKLLRRCRYVKGHD